MSYRSRRADLACEEDVDHLTDLHKLTFGDTAPLAELDYGAWWLIYPFKSGFMFQMPVAFAGIVPASLGNGIGYLKRAGVLKDHCGHGLQRRLIRMREAYARKQGWHTIVTETSPDNIPSANNLIKAGYKIYEPETKWGVKGAIYWRKPLGDK